MIAGAGLDALSLPLIGGLLVAGFAGLAEIGYLVHHRLGGQRDGEASDEGQVLGAALVLLALLLGFTFSMALSRYDSRRALVVQEANDIGTAWLRAGLYATPAAAALQGELATYARTRIGAPGRTPDDEVRVRRAGAVMRRAIWTSTAAVTAPDRSTAQAAALVAAVNAVLDTATTRETAIDARVPETVVDLLAVYAGVSALLLGYVLSAFGSRHRVASLVLFVLLAMTIVLILDLDRPQSGAIRVSQQPMIDLVADIGAGPTGVQTP